MQVGLHRGKSSPCTFRQHTWDCCIFIHGDGFVVNGVEEHLKQVQKAICDVCLTKVRRVIGPESHDTKAMAILNRIVEWRTDGIVMEADPTHVELGLRELGIRKCKGSDVVGSQQDGGDDVLLSTSDARRFRSLAARCNFLAADRVDIQFGCKEICRRMPQPCESDWMLLKTIARYMNAHPRMINVF